MPGELARENQALRQRLSRLSEASLRINESLDFETVLQGVLDSARSLTGARYGVITLLDDAGRRPGGAHRHRVPDAGGTIGQRRAPAHPPAPAATGLGAGQGPGLRAGAEHRQEAAAASWTTTRTCQLYLRLAHRRLPHGGGSGSIIFCFIKLCNVRIGLIALLLPHLYPHR